MIVQWQPGITLAQMEKDIIYKALKFFQGNKVQTASALGITARTLYNKLEVYEGKKISDDGVQTDGRPHVESTLNVSEKQSVPVREREEIQKVPSPRVAKDSSNQRNKGSAPKSKTA